MKKITALLVVAMLSVAAAFSAASIAKAETEKELKYVSFPVQAEADWTSFSWGDGTAACTVEKVLSDEYSKGNDLSLKMTKTVTSEGNSFAAVYYQQFGAKVTSLNASEPYGVRFSVYSEAAVSGGLGFKFDSAEQADITCVQDGSEEVLTSRDLDYQGYRTYTVPFTVDLDAANVKEFQIFIWGADSATIYISNMELIYTGGITVGPEEPVDPEPPKDPDLGEYSLILSSFEADDFALWSKSGQSGTVYKTERNTDKTYVKDGDSSLKYSWENPLYAFGWTEVYLDVSEDVERNKDTSLTGLSFDIYNTAEQTVGEVGFWVKVAEADGSEYEVDPGMLVNGTALDFTGWRTVKIPFEAFTPERLASYTEDENEKFDPDQLAYVKIGIWGNSKEVVNVEFYLDTLRLHAENEMDDGSVPAPIDPVEENKGCNGCNSSVAYFSSALIAAIAAGGAAIWLITRRKRNSK
ncbi:MAG: glycan-binding surface protein [Candidatus Borkfalkiaceae bacterium]|nr:glycan-binding surface protein [Christensenellaceae bacterium]